NLGATGSFSVETNTGTFTYQWRRNGQDIPGANQASYTTPPVTIDDDGALYSVVVTNVFGSTPSNPAKLTVNLLPPIFSGPTATPLAAAINTVITFSASAAGSKGQAVTYSWNFGDG